MGCARRPRGGRERATAAMGALPCAPRAGGAHHAARISRQGATAMSDILLSSRDAGVVTLALHRPDRLNAVTKQLWEALRDALAGIDREDGVRCVVLRGAGERAFSVGNDIAEFEAERSNAAQARAYGAVMHAALAALRGLRHPTVALVHGACVGSGLELAACCDLRVCGVSSRFGAPVAKLGLVMAHVEMEALLAIASRAAALEIL